MTDRIARKHDTAVIKEMVKTIEPLIKLTLPSAISNKSVIDLVYKFFKLSKDKVFFFGECMVFVTGNETGTQQDRIRKFCFELMEYLHDMTKEQQKEFISLLELPVSSIIKKDITILDMNFSKTLQKCVDAFSYENTEESLALFRMLLDKVILTKISNLSLSDLLVYVEKIQK